MVRLSSPISSRLILAGSYAGIAGVTFYLVTILFFGIDIDLEEEAVNESLHGVFNYLELAILMLQALGPVFGMIVTAIPFFPFTFLYASWVCPSRITITSTEIRAKFFGAEKTWQMSELESVKFQHASDQEFIILKVSGKTLKAEIEHGNWGRIRDLLPIEIAVKAGT
ncbi:hypothetical protein [Pelagicoccus mobilis]|uniref:Uncharacterized protein n=1 Tax=Pelagicoccus mobilis TaxID=415221 RepID=A0A934VQJ9_9BACT|nr:hypothetical protein [Pelagicoccus mobilis]MBK1876980.1 hypothetical protein [Pelagicoccus mobilis]